MEIDETEKKGFARVTLQRTHNDGLVFIVRGRGIDGTLIIEDASLCAAELSEFGPRKLGNRLGDFLYNLKGVRKATIEYPAENGDFFKKFNASLQTYFEE